ncbi:MAG: DUF4288 domain-containing protein [Cyclobacteriaceae bacterium]|jgi:hypothetical protein|nr:DUF4288 domain-containing protein [Flammeovirgaceae bacterium]
MKWYLAKFVYQKVSGSGPTPQFDEQLRLIKAEEYQWACEKASILGRLFECDFTNKKDDPGKWKFVSVVDVLPMGLLQDGEEIYSTIEQPKDVTDYLNRIKVKSGWQPSNE